MNATPPPWNPDIEWRAVPVPKSPSRGTTTSTSSKTRRGKNYDIGEFDPDATKVTLADGSTSLVRLVAAGLNSPTDTAPCHCHEHADQSPSAWVGKTFSGEPMIGCSSCTTVWLPVRSSPDLASATSVVTATGYMPDVVLTKPVTVMHADTGSGKTRQLERIVKEVLDAGGRVLVVVHRKSLAWGLAKRLGLLCYLDPSLPPVGEIDADAVVVCLNSICRIALYPRGRDPLDEGVVGFDLIIIEESESVAEHLTGGTMLLSGSYKNDARANSGEVFHHWQTLTKATLLGGWKLVSTDAFTSTLTEVLLERLTGLRRTDFEVVRHLGPRSDHEVVVYEDYSDIVVWLYGQIVAGKRVAIACTSATDAKLLEYLVGEIVLPGGGKPKLLAYHRTMDNPTRETLKDVERHWLGIDALVYSPSVDTGVSFDPAAVADRFDIVALVARTPRSPGDAPGFGTNKLHQMADRLRQMKRLHVWLDPTWRHDLPTDIAIIRKEFETRVAQTGQAIKHVVRDGRLVPAPADEDHFEVAVEVERSRRLRSSRVREHYLAWWTSRQATITPGEALDDDRRKQVNEFLRLVKKDQGRRWGEDVADSDPMSEDESFRVVREGGSQDQILAAERTRHLATFGTVKADVVTRDRYRKVTHQIRRVVDAGLFLDKQNELATQADYKRWLTGYRANQRAEAQRTLAALIVLTAGLGLDVVLALFDVLRIGVSEPPAGFEEIGFGTSGGSSTAVHTPPVHTPRSIEDHLQKKISACGPEPRWSNPILVARGFRGAILHGLAKLEGSPDQILAGLGVSFGSLDESPVKALGMALEYFGLGSTEAGRPRVNGKRVREYGLGIEKVVEMLWLAQRHNLRRRGFTVPHVEAIDPKSKLILLAVDPSRGPNSVMDEIDQYVAALAA